MAYRNGTYIAFHANGTNVPIDSDIKYYNLMKAWTAKKDDDFSRECSIKCVNSLHHPRFLGVSLRGDDWRP